jgi:outer membrane protein OmpA-like peptidoglycan-associated protein
MTELMDVFQGDALNRIASTIGENPARTHAALGSVVPSLLGGLANKASTAERAGGLLDLIRRHGLDSDAFADPVRALTAPDGFNTLTNVGGPLIASLFGMRSAAMSDRVASFAGVSPSVSSSLMKLVLPLLLGMIARHVKAAGWNAASVMQLLGEQRSYLEETPAALLDAGETTPVREVAYGVDEKRHAPVAVAHERSHRGSAWRWALPMLLLIPLIGWFLSRSDEPRREASVQTPSTRVVPMPLPKSTPDPSRPVGTTGVTSSLPTGLGPYRITFGTASDDPMSESSAQLRDVADALKAHPQAKVEITGYTDSVGDDASNLRLSQQRATETLEQMAGLGIDRSRMTAEGHGESNPVGDNSTAEGRHQNRRVEIRVTDK